MAYQNMLLSLWCDTYFSLKKIPKLASQLTETKV